MLAPLQGEGLSALQGLTEQNCLGVSSAARIATVSSGMFAHTRGEGLSALQGLAQQSSLGLSSAARIATTSSGMFAHTQGEGLSALQGLAQQSSLGLSSAASRGMCSMHQPTGHTLGVGVSAIRALEDAGASRELAGAIIATVDATVEQRLKVSLDSMEDNLAAAIAKLSSQVEGIKEDIKGVKIDVQGVKEDLKSAWAGIKEDIKGVKEDVKSAREDVKSARAAQERRLMRYENIFIAGSVVALIAAVQVFG